MFINKDWENSDRNSLGSYILIGKVGDFGIRFYILDCGFMSSSVMLGGYFFKWWCMGAYKGTEMGLS